MTPPSAGGWPSTTPPSSNALLPTASGARLKQTQLSLPVLPTTTIGSFPQTPSNTGPARPVPTWRDRRADLRRRVADHIDGPSRFQEEVGLDVLVHGEPERNDMVEYFGELLTGCLVTTNGWVQSYGSRCVKPPIIYGDVSRPRPMTVDWAIYAQSRTSDQ